MKVQVLLAFLISGCLIAETAVLDCSVTPTNPKCKPRGDGPVTLEGQKMFEDLLNDLISKFMNGTNGGSNQMQQSEAVQTAEYISDSLSQLSFVRQIMQSRQGEIDEVVQFLLPEAQRNTVWHTTKAGTLREKILVATSQMSRVTQGLPKDDYVDEQRKFENIIVVLHTLRNSVDHQGKTLIAEALGESALLSSSATTQQNGEVVLKKNDGTTVGHVTYVIDELISSFKDARKAHQKASIKERQEWGNEIDGIQEYVDELMRDLHRHQKIATEYLAQTAKFKMYIKQLTSEQYRDIEWYQTVKQNLRNFGQHLHKSLIARAEISLAFQEIAFFVSHGDVAYPIPTLDGCDGKGSIEDVCGICGGSNTTCLDCNQQPNGDAKMDVCSVCGDGQGHDCRYFCDGNANSGKVEDLCGVCNGNEKACVGCDHLPHSPFQFDTCGVCGGDGQSCAKAKGCENVQCPNEIRCPVGQIVVNTGYRGCCFNPATDCTVSSLTM
jgi:hypothetical protein